MKGLTKPVSASLWKVLLCIALVVTSFTPTFAEASSGQKSATIVELNGDVFVTKGAGKREIKAFNGMGLTQGDTIRTGKGAYARVEFDKDNAVSLAQNTTITLAELTDKNGVNSTKVKQSSGGIWNKVKRSVGAGDTYEVETPTSIMGVRGTLFLTHFDNGRTTLSVLDGIVGARDSQRRTTEDQQDVPELLIPYFEQLLSDMDGLPDLAELDLDNLGNIIDIDILIDMIHDALEVAQQGVQDTEEMLEQLIESEQAELILRAREEAARAVYLNQLAEQIASMQRDSARDAELQRRLEERNRQTQQQLEERIRQQRERAEQAREQAEQAANQAREQLERDRNQAINDRLNRLDDVNERLAERRQQQQERSQSQPTPSSSGAGGGTGPAPTPDPEEPNYGTVTGMVYQECWDCDGFPFVPLEGLDLQVFKDGQTGEWTGKTNTDGLYSIQVPEGEEYRIVAEDEDHSYEIYELIFPYNQDFPDYPEEEIYVAIPASIPVVFLEMFFGDISLLPVHFDVRADEVTQIENIHLMPFFEEIEFPDFEFIELKVTEVTANSITVTWDPYDKSELSSYRVYINDIEVGYPGKDENTFTFLSTIPTYQWQGEQPPEYLQPSTTYEIRLEAYAQGADYPRAIGIITVTTLSD